MNSLLTGFLASYEALHEAFLASKRAAEVDGHPEWPDIQLYFGHNFDNGTGKYALALEKWLEEEELVAKFSYFIKAEWTQSLTKCGIIS